MLFIFFKEIESKEHGQPGQPVYESKSAWVASSIIQPEMTLKCSFHSLDGVLHCVSVEMLTVFKILVVGN